MRMRLQYTESLLTVRSLGLGVGFIISASAASSCSRSAARFSASAVSRSRCPPRPLCQAGTLQAIGIGVDHKRPIVFTCHAPARACSGTCWCTGLPTLFANDFACHARGGDSEPQLVRAAFLLRDAWSMRQICCIGGGGGEGRLW